MTTTMREEAIGTVTVSFIDRGRKAWDGRSAHRMRPASGAFLETHQDRKTGAVTIGIGWRERRNALIEVSFDLWRIGFDLSPETVNRLEQQWLSLCAPLPRTMRRKIGFASFGRCFSTFNVPIEQREDWREFLKVTLSDAGSYVGIEHCRDELQ